MDHIEGSVKRRKLEDGVSSTTENHVTNGHPGSGGSVATPSRAQSHLQFNHSMFERLRKITKDCRKNFQPTPKLKGSKLPLAKGKGNEDSSEENKSTAASAGGSDFVISSAGSSPAHSPQPMDFEILSTPPRPSRPKPADVEVLSTSPRTSKLEPKNFEVLATPLRTSTAKVTIENGAVNFELAHNSTEDGDKILNRNKERLEEGSSKRTLPNGVYTDTRILEQNTTSVEVLEEGDQTNLGSGYSSKTGDAVNGKVNSLATRKDVSQVSVPNAIPRTNSVEGTGGLNLNSEDFREMIKKMIEERMKQIERSMGRENAEKLTLLEQENTALRDHANKLEASLKKLTESEARKERVTRSVQTQDINLYSDLCPKTSGPAPLQITVAVTRPSSMGLVLDTTPTPRLTSTVAPLPGHTVPSRLENTPVGYQHASQRPQLSQKEPLRPRIPSMPSMSPRTQQAGGNYAPNYDPGPTGRSVPGQLTGLRGASPANFSSQGVPRINNALTAQPVVRMQGPVVSPGDPRSNTTPSSRPLPTVTVHPQTQTPPSVSSMRVQQEPSAYGYPAQNVFNNGQPRPRFTVNPQMRLQRPPHPQSVPQQISPGPRTPVFQRSPTQAASSTQRIMQQPIRMEQQKTQLPRPSAPIRANPPVQIQAGIQRRPQQHNAVTHYQQLPTPQRQGTPTQPSANYGTAAIRGPQPTPAGIPQQLPGTPIVQTKEAPPKPTVSIAVVTSGIVLSWNMALEDRHATIMNYQLFALQDGGTVENAHQWKKIGVVKALPLPMACTLTQFLPGNKYHFAVRATDETGRLGPFSDPCTITLK